MSSRVTFTVSLPFRIRKEGAYFVSWCFPLDVYSQGKTREEAEKNLVEAVRLFLTNCFERATLDRVLKDCGFTPAPVSRRKAAALKKSTRYPEISVPLPFVFEERIARCQG
jgi:predicted RNase H-like HicB family nuclease